MDNSTITTEQRYLIERYGVFMGRSHLQPAASRILGLLLISDKPELTFDEIKEALGLSKSAVSNALAILLNSEQIYYVTFPGDRKRYFKNNIARWESEVLRNFSEISSIRLIMNEILSQRPDHTKELNSRISDLISFLTFFDNEVQGLFKKWKLTQNNK